MDEVRRMFDLAGEVAVVIGATGVLGGVIAEGMAAAGAKVAVLGRSKERGNARVKAIREAGGKGAEFFEVDVLEGESLREAEKGISRKLGAPTILINAAGGNDVRANVSEEQPLQKLDLEDWYRTFDLNMVGGALVPCQVFGPGMVSRKKGSIINIASVSAHVPLSRVVTYSAAKAAVLNFSRFLAQEWAPHGVRVNTLTPGFFPAEQNRRHLLREDGTPTDRARQILSQTPMRRFGEPYELVGAAIFLACPQAASFVTGADLVVDGGFLASKC